MRGQKYDQPAPEIGWWYANGLHGYLHMYRNCPKLRNGRRELITRNMTLYEATTFGHGMCLTCLYGTNGPWTEQHYEQTARLAHVEKCLQEPGYFDWQENNKTHLAAWRKMQMCADLTTTTTAIEARHGLYLWKQHIAQTIQQHTPGPAQYADIATETLHLAATEVLWYALRHAESDPELMGGDDIVAIIGNPMWKCKSPEGVTRNLIGETAQEWCKLLGQGACLAEATKMILENINHLQQKYDHQWPVNAGEGAQRQFLDALKRALDAWETRHRQLTAQASPVLFGTTEMKHEAYSWRTYPLTRYVMLATLNWVHANNKNLLVCHPTIGQYVTKLSVLRDEGISQWVNNYTAAVPLDEVPSTDDLLGTLWLWEPGNDESLYGDLGRAFNAAKTL